MTENPLEEAACTCKVIGECETCKRWHAKISEVIARRREEKN